MKRRFWTVALFVAVMCMALGCGEAAGGGTGSPEEPRTDFTYYTVTFDSRGGSAIESASVLDGNTVPRPNLPTRSGYFLTGWYRSATPAEDNRWDFEVDRVVSDITLYAGWESDQNVEPTASLTYTLTDGGYVVTGVADETFIVIPSEYEERSVVGIGDGAFTRTYIVSVSIPDSVTSIGLNAFHNCANLETVALSENSALTSIGNNAFSGNTVLRGFYIPKGVVSIGDSAFNNCGAIENFVVDGDNEIYAAMNGHLVEKASGLLIRGANNALVPEGVRSIGLAAFREGLLESVELPSTVENIGNYAFDDCENMRSITVADSNTAFAAADGILYNADMTEMVAVPTRLGGDIALPSSLVSIPYGAFDWRDELTSVFIPVGSLDSIGAFSFRGTTLTIRYAGLEREWNEISKSVVWGGEGLVVIFGASESDVDKVLVAYFSWSGNTEEIAGFVATETGGDLVEIVPASAYTTDYSTLYSVALDERSRNARPAISADTYAAIDVSNYSAVFIGYPIWHGNEPMIIRTFIDHYSGFENMKVFTFSSSGSSGGNAAHTSIASLCADTATVGSNLHFTSRTLGGAQASVRTWVSGLDLNI